MHWTREEKKKRFIFYKNVCLYIVYEKWKGRGIVNREEIWCLYTFSVLKYIRKIGNRQHNKFGDRDKILNIEHHFYHRIHEFRNIGIFWMTRKLKIRRKTEKLSSTAYNSINCVYVYRFIPKTEDCISFFLIRNLPKHNRT